MTAAAPEHWLNLEVALPAERFEAVCGLLEAAGALAVSSVDAGDRPVLEPAPGSTPLWPDLIATALFAGDYDPAPLCALLASAGVQVLSSRRVEPQDWARVGQDVQARHFGAGLWVCPGDGPAPAPDAVVVRLDAGLGFGTGAHPTTALCLRWLAEHRPAGQAVIDWGCGSGILAVAAARLGARRVVALDIDPQALAATQANAQRNGVTDRVQVMAPEALPASETAELVLANILAPVLAELAPRLLTATRPGGALLLSGLLENQVAQIVLAFGPAVRFAAPVVERGWVCLSGIKQ